MTKLMGRRYSDDGVPEWDLNAVHLKYKNQLLDKMASGIYRTETVTECLCKSTELERLSHKDRFGLPFGNAICRHCGLIITTPRLARESLPDFYSNEYHALVFGTEDIGEFEFMFKKEQGNLIFNFIEKHISDKKSLKVAEIGAGVGHILRIIKENAKSRGIEVEAHGCEYSKACVNYGNEKLGLNLVQGGTKALFDRGVKFDVIIMSHVLEHFPSPYDDLGLIVQLLNEGGLVYVEVPGVLDIHNKTEYKCDYLRYSVCAHMYNYSLGTLVNTMSACGFEMIEGSEYVKSLFRVRDGSTPTSLNYYNKTMDYLENLEMNMRIYNEVGKIRIATQRIQESYLSELKKLRAEKAALQHAHDALLNSASWKVTAPLRRIREFLAGKRSK